MKSFQSLFSSQDSFPVALKPLKPRSRTFPSLSINPLIYPRPVELAVDLIQVRMWNDLDLPSFYIRIQIGHSTSHKRTGFFGIQGLCRHPQAELIIFQAGHKIWHQDLDLAWFRLVEEAEMRAPGYRAYHVNARPCCPRLHGRTPCTSNNKYRYIATYMAYKYCSEIKP